MTHIEELACISESSGSQFFRATSGIQSGSDAFIKGGKRFFKNGSNGRDGKFLLEMGGSQEWGGGVLSLHSWQGVITPLFYEEPLYCLPHPPFFSNFVHAPLPHFLVTSNLHPTCSFYYPVSLAEWVIIPHLMCYFT